MKRTYQLQNLLRTSATVSRHAWQTKSGSPRVHHSRRAQAGRTEREYATSVFKDLTPSEASLIGWAEAPHRETLPTVSLRFGTVLKTDRELPGALPAPLGQRCPAVLSSDLRQTRRGRSTKGYALGF